MNIGKQVMKSITQWHCHLDLEHKALRQQLFLIVTSQERLHRKTNETSRVYVIKIAKFLVSTLFFSRTMYLDLLPSGVKCH
jgi:hypothetical protein